MSFGGHYCGTAEKGLDVKGHRVLGKYFPKGDVYLQIRIRLNAHYASHPCPCKRLATVFGPIGSRAWYLNRFGRFTSKPILHEYLHYSLIIFWRFYIRRWTHRLSQVLLRHNFNVFNDKTKMWNVLNDMLLFFSKTGIKYTAFLLFMTRFCAFNKNVKMLEKLANSLHCLFYSRKLQSELPCPTPPNK